MGKVTQIAFQIDDDSLAAVDRMAAADSLARAEVLRIAVRCFLAQRREAEIESHLAAGYRNLPPGGEADQLAEVSLEGLRSGQLDW